MDRSPHQEFAEIIKLSDKDKIDQIKLKLTLQPFLQERPRGPSLRQEDAEMDKQNVTLSSLIFYQILVS